MKNRTARMTGLLLVCVTFSMTPSASNSALPAPHPLGNSPWNGDWVISKTRNPKSVQDEAAEGYRFQLDHVGHIIWEIPTLKEVVDGRIDGQPMTIRRPKPTTLSLAVTADGPYTLLYKVFRDKKLDGEGRMTLIDEGAAWVDISQPAGRPDLAAAVIYVRPSAAGR